MTDNLDPNDLSWLNDPNGQDEDDFNSEFGTEQLLPDWELPSSDSGDGDDQFSGLFDDAPDVSSLNNPAVVTSEIPSWLQASAPTSGTQDMNVVDNLIPLGQPVNSDTEGIPSWLDTQEMAAAPIANKEDVPPWLAEADETSAQAFTEAEAQAESQPMVAPGDQASNLPAWLQDADDLGAADANAFESSFDDLDFDVDANAASGGVSDPFGGAISQQPASSVFGEDIPAWMQTREQSGVPQDDFASLMADMPTIPGETTDPLLSNLLQSGGGAGDADLDLLSLLEQTNGGESIRTGMLAPIEGRNTSPSDISDDDFPDFATLLAQPDPTPEFHPMLDEPTAQADAPFDFSMLRLEQPQTSAPDDDSSAFNFSMLGLEEPQDAQPVDDSASFDFSTLGLDEPQASEPVDTDAFDFSQFEARATDLAPTPAAAPLPPVEPSTAPPPLKMPATSGKSRLADDDFSAFLSSLEGDELAFDSRPISNSEPLDLGALLRDPGFGDLADTPNSAEDVPVVPEFLRDVSVRASSVAALLRQQQDVPLDDLPEELRALHDELAAIQLSPVSSETALPPLPAAPLIPSGPRSIPGLTDSQRRGAELLRALANVTGVASDEADAAVQATQKRTSRRRFGINAIRLLLAASLMVAVILPFVSDADILKVGIQPPAVFAPSSGGGQAYDLIEALPAGALVLVSADYSPGSIAELDSLSEPILRHLFARGLKPVVIGSDPVTLQHVGRLADKLGQGRQRNVDYVIGRYLLGEAIGTQDFLQSIDTLLERDINGLPTQLDVTDINAFAGVIVLTDRADTVRVWAEQVQPYMTVPLTFAVGAGASPLSAPYATIGGGRFLAGLRDGITYSSQLDAQYPPRAFVIPTLPPATAIPTLQPPTATIEVDVTASPDPAATVGTPEPTVEGTTTLAATEITGTPDAIATSITATLETTPPTAEPTLEPTATADGGSAQATPGPTLSFTVFAVITGTGRVNVRQGPGTNFQILTSVESGERFRLISGASDGQWLQIELPDERVGWVSAARAQIEQSESSLPGMRVGAGGSYQFGNLAITTNTERRWSAVSLGAIVAAVLMGLGSIVGVIQIILRRRR